MPLPEEYWINVRLSDGRETVAETTFSKLDDCLDDVLSEFSGLAYLHTIHVVNTSTRGQNHYRASVADLTDDARAHEREARIEERHRRSNDAYYRSPAR